MQICLSIELAKRFINHNSAVQLEIVRSAIVYKGSFGSVHKIKVTPFSPM